MIALTGIEPTSPALWADMLTTTLQCPSDGSTEIELSHSTMDSHSGGERQRRRDG